MSMVPPTPPARFPDDPEEPFWWWDARCLYCEAPEVALGSTSPSRPFVCMACGALHTTEEVWGSVLNAARPFDPPALMGDW